MTKLTERCISVYDKQTGTLQRELPLSNVSLSDLQRIFKGSPEDPMLEVLDIGPNEAAQLQDSISEKLDLDMFDYQLDCYAIETKDTGLLANRIKKFTFNPFIRFFEKNTSRKLIKNAELQSFSIEDLRKIFGLPDDESVEEELPINETQAIALQKFTPEKIDLTHYDCVLESNIDYIWVSLYPESGTVN